MLQVHEGTKRDSTKTNSFSMIYSDEAELVYHIDYHGVTTHPNPTPKHHPWSALGTSHTSCKHIDIYINPNHSNVPFTREFNFDAVISSFSPLIQSLLLTCCLKILKIERKNVNQSNWNWADKLHTTEVNRVVSLSHICIILFWESQLARLIRRLSTKKILWRLILSAIYHCLVTMNSA